MIVTPEFKVLDWILGSLLAQLAAVCDLSKGGDGYIQLIQSCKYKKVAILKFNSQLLFLKFLVISSCIIIPPCICLYKVVVTSKSIK